MMFLLLEGNLCKVDSCHFLKNTHTIGFLRSVQEKGVSLGTTEGLVKGTIGNHRNI